MTITIIALLVRSERTAMIVLALGTALVLNRSGTTFRKLPAADKEGLNEKKALGLMLAQPSMIKRPVLEAGGKLLVGFSPSSYARDVKTR